MQRMSICSIPIIICRHIPPLQVIKGGCFSLEGAGESVSYSASTEQDGERGGSGEGGTVPHMNKSERSCVAHCPPPSGDDCSRGDWRVCPPQ